MKKNYINGIYENYCYNLNYLEHRIKSSLDSEWVFKVFKLNRQNYYYRKKRNRFNKLYINIYYIQKYTQNIISYRWTFNSIKVRQLSTKFNKQHKQIKILSNLTKKREPYVKQYQSFSLKGYNIITEKVLETKHVRRHNFFTILNKFNNDVYNQNKKENK